MLWDYLPIMRDIDPNLAPGIRVVQIDQMWCYALAMTSRCINFAISLLATLP